MGIWIVAGALLLVGLGGLILGKGFNWEAFSAACLTAGFIFSAVLISTKKSKRRRHRRRMS